MVLKGNRLIFRDGALAKRDAPEELTDAVRVVGARSWPALLLIGIVFAAGISWCFVGRIPVSLKAAGLLTAADGSFGVQAPVAGQITRVNVRPGAMLPGGAVVADIAGDDGPVRVRTAVPGRVSKVFIHRGQPVTAGSALCAVERVGDKEEAAVAVVYVPVSSSASVTAGLAVDVEVDAAPAAAFGSIRGRVLRADVAAESRLEIANFLADDEVAAAVTADGPARRVVVELDRDQSTPSGYRWTRGSGPPFRIGTSVSVRARIHQESLRPVDWMLR